MQIKNHNEIPLHTSEWLRKKISNTDCWSNWHQQDVEQLALSHPAGGNAKWYSHSARVWQVLIKVNIHLPCNPAILLLDSYSREMKTKNLYTNMYNNLIHKRQKPETNQMPLNWWMDKQNVVHLYSGLLSNNKNEWPADTHATRWMNLQYIMLKKQSIKATGYMIPFLWQFWER